MSANLVAAMFCPEVMVLPDSDDSAQQSRWLKFKEPNDKDIYVGECSKFLKEMELLGSDSENDPDESDVPCLKESVVAGRNLYKDFVQCTQDDQNIKAKAAGQDLK